MVQYTSSRWSRVAFLGAAIVGGAALATAAHAGPTTDQSWAEMGYANPDSGQVVPIPSPEHNAGDPAHAANGTAQRRIQNYNEGSPQP